MILSVIGLLLIQSCWSSRVGTEGCETWRPRGSADDVCCDRCKPGNRIFKSCGPVLEDLCTPCENGTFTLDPSRLSCTKCKQCGGVQHTMEACTRTKDTQCGCQGNLLCKDSHCSICVKECGIGREPEGGSCRTCPDGTFNDQNNQKCKPWKSIRCTHPDEYMIKGNAYTDSKCIAKATTTATMTTTTQRNIEGKKEDSMLPWWLVIAVSCVVLLIPFILMIKVITKLKVKKGKQTTTKTPFITNFITTDEPRTLMAIECSFHEPEQVSGSEAAEDSEGSTLKLIV